MTSFSNGCIRTPARPPMSTRSDGRVGLLTILAGLHELPDETDELARLLGRAKHPLIFSPSPRSQVVGS